MRAIEISRRKIVNQVQQQQQQWSFHSKRPFFSSLHNTTNATSSSLLINQSNSNNSNSDKIHISTRSGSRSLGNKSNRSFRSVADVSIPNVRTALQFQSSSSNRNSSSNSSTIQQPFNSFASSSPSSSLINNCPPCNSINLVPLIPNATLQTIRTLPEVEQVLSSLQSNTNNNTKTILDGLERAIQIFEHVGKSEYKAMLLLKATFLSRQYLYDETIQVLSSILSISDGNVDVNGELEKNKNYHERFEIISCLSKMNWYNGSFGKGLEYATTMNEMESSSSSSSSSTTMTKEDRVFRHGCAMNALALNQLVSLGPVEDADITRIKSQSSSLSLPSSHSPKWQDVLDVHNTLKVSSEMLEIEYKATANANANANRSTSSSTRSIKVALACAASYSNQGVVDLIYNIQQHRDNHYNNKEGNNNSDTITSYYDSAMTTWKKGIHILDEMEEQNSTIFSDDTNTIHYNYLCKSIKARLYCNMAWTILFHSSYNTILTSSHDNDDDLNDKVQQQPLKEDELKIASEYAGSALKLYDEIMVIVDGTNNETTLKPIMGRALGLVASCYARAGSAVTAEGLLQSAFDLYKKGDNNDSQSIHSQNQNDCPMYQIDSRSIFFYYSSLCRNWDKRSADAKQNEENALDINNNMLNEKWKGTSAIYSGLWFFTISDF